MNTEERKRILAEMAKAERWAAWSMITSVIACAIMVILFAIRIGGAR